MRIKMRVAVGSLNKSKIRGVEKAFKIFYPEAVIMGVDVKGLEPQPIGFDMILRNSVYRASKALEISDTDLGVSVEAGLIGLVDRWFDIHVAVIIDREKKITYGLSSGFEIPKNFVEKIFNKEASELEELVNRYYNVSNAGEIGGFIRFLSREIITREDLVFNATLMALIPRINRELYYR